MVTFKVQSQGRTARAEAGRMRRASAEECRSSGRRAAAGLSRQLLRACDAVYAGIAAAAAACSWLRPIRLLQAHLC